MLFPVVVHCIHYSRIVHHVFTPQYNHFLRTGICAVSELSPLCTVLPPSLGHVSGFTFSKSFSSLYTQESKFILISWCQLVFWRGYINYIPIGSGRDFIDLYFLYHLVILILLDQSGNNSSVGKRRQCSVHRENKVLQSTNFLCLKSCSFRFNRSHSGTVFNLSKHHYVLLSIKSVLFNLLNISPT